MTGTTLKRRLAALEAEPKASLPAVPYPGLVEAIHRRAANYPVQPLQPDEEVLLRRMAADLGKVQMFAGAWLDQMTDRELEAAEIFLWHAEHMRMTGGLYPSADTVEQWRTVFERCRSIQPKAFGAMWIARSVRNRATGEPPPFTMVLALGITPRADE